MAGGGGAGVFVFSFSIMWVCFVCVRVICVSVNVRSICLCVVCMSVCNVHVVLFVSYVCIMSQSTPEVQDFLELSSHTCDMLTSQLRHFRIGPPK